MEDLLNREEFFNNPSLNTDMMPEIIEPRQISKEEEKKELIRQKIAEDAGDINSLLGTNSNISQISFLILTTFMKSLKEGNSFEDVKKSMEAFFEISENFLENIKTGKTKLVHSLDDLKNILEEFEERTTKITNVLEEAKSK